MRRHSKTPRNYVALIATAGLLLPFTGSAQVSVLTANYDNARTNANLEETILTPASVNPRSFGKIGAFPVDGQIYAQPLYIAGLNVPGQGQRDVVFVVTMNNTVYAIDAHAPQPTVALWQASLGDALPSSVISLKDIDPSIGILSTPVIDPTGNVIYVVAETLENNQPVFRLHALDLSDGHETMNGPVEIQATVPGIGDASQNGQIAFDPFQHLQRPGLLLLNGAVYVAFASHHDTSPYHGWIMSYDASNLQNQLAVLNTTPNGGGGGIWQSGRSLAADANGNIFVATGNGDYDGVLNFGECFLRLSQNLSVLDWFAPSDWLALSDNDYDLGALGPVLVPGSSLLVGGDKAGNFYVADSANLGHLGTSGAAHELGTPLGTIAVVAKELERYASALSGSDSVLEDARLIRSEVERCRRILERMSVQGAEPMGEAARKILVADLLNEVVEQLPESQRTVVVVEVEDEGLAAVLPEQATLQSVAALLQNAIDANREQRPVIVRASGAGPELSISIRDRGHGMPESVLRRIAEPFFTTKEPGKGMGLGTFLVRTFAERLGGRLLFESTDGQGTVVTLLLPLGKDAHAAV